jgi:hypothetical protein
MFEDLMFPWTNFPPFSAWIQAMPLAAPIAILILVSQSSGTRSPPLFPAKVTYASEDTCNSQVINQFTDDENRMEEINKHPPQSVPY